jgi:hypothetical protein
VLEPALVPEDVELLDVQSGLLIGLSQILPTLIHVKFFDGLGPKSPAIRWSSDELGFVVRFSTLYDYVKSTSSAVFVAVVEERGEVMVQHYLEESPQALDNVALILDTEMAQRYFVNSHPLPDSKGVTALLEGKVIDPLLCCLVGYACIRQGELEPRSTIVHRRGACAA